MKGVIPFSLASLVTDRFGKDKWTQVLKAAGLDPGTVFLAVEDVADATVMQLLDATCKTLGLTLAQAADAFGDYWVNTTAQKVYKPYFTGKKTAREFLLRMDEVHVAATNSIPNAHPPRFSYEWKSDKVLVMTYKSPRGLIDLLPGLVKAVGKHFHEELEVTKIGASGIQITFP